MAGMFSSHVRSNVIGYLALFVALSGTAWAATELDKNEVKSKHIGKGQVKNADLANNSVTSPKVADGSLLDDDFAAGQLPQGPEGPQGPRGEQGPQGEQGIQGQPGTARAYGRVSASGALSRSKNIASVTEAASNEGAYCVELDPSIPASTAVLLADPDYNGDLTSSSVKAFAEPYLITCGTNGLRVQTGISNYDTTDDDDGGGNTTGTSNSFTNQPFVVMVP